MAEQTLTFDFAFQTALSHGSRVFTLDAAVRTPARRLAILGPSGSGKSLTLQLLAGLMRPQRGHVFIAGQCYGDTAQNIWLPPQQRRAGLLFQDYALFPHLTVAQNIAFGLHQGLFSPSRRRARLEAAEWLDKMQLDTVADHYPSQISGGQRQRTALARTCITSPSWLLLDEPFSALDTALRAQMRGHTAALQRELGIPLLLITHDPEDAKALADETAVIENGRLRHGC
ncbi:Spermidine/putrescine import ATP-binding protein PotA [Kingella potus]|uniref:Spermidine/putrescine import ATP-binding protein PotA n=1 Tax=Kingella potus TaxID=265175 RepID=A0A377QX81_9NEIS|nr:ATP-binding cassette domain-containing protein [Kingella potus]STR00006.1 Spermidine/putrescine import ATP-binding protein PotA [Kingella potus]